MSDKPNPPSPTDEDLNHLLIKAGLSVVPIVGGPAAEIFAYVCASPLEKRRDEWNKSVGARLLHLEENGLKLDDLRDNDQFIDTVLQATQIALRTHNQTKRTALRNAIENTAIGRAPDDVLRDMFLNFIDTFSEEHLSILDLFDNPEGWFKRAGKQWPNLYAGGLSAILEVAFPQFQTAQSVYDQLWRDLFQRGLLNTEHPRTMMTGNGLAAKRTTDLGDRFLAFIRGPENGTL